MERLTRRQFLRTSGVAGIAGVAGCLGDDSGGDGTDPTQTPTDTATFDGPVERDVDPSRTYLRTNGDDAGAARPIDLASLNLRPGATVRLERVGSFTGSSNGTGMTGVFSGSATLDDADARNRVVDAIDAGEDYETSATYEGGAATDVPEDFLVADNEGDQTGVTVTVPDGATHLFVAAIDNFYQDNSHADTRFGLRIELA